MVPGGQEIGQADLVLFCDRGLVLVDYKTHSGERTSLQEVPAGYAGQLAAYRTAPEIALVQRCLGAFVCFPLRGEIVEVFLAE